MIVTLLNLQAKGKHHVCVYVLPISSFLVDGRLASSHQYVYVHFRDDDYDKTFLPDELTFKGGSNLISHRHIVFLDTMKNADHLPQLAMVAHKVRPDVLPLSNKSYLYFIEI
jgi:hypothetical protein